MNAWINRVATMFASSSSYWGGGSMRPDQGLITSAGAHGAGFRRLRDLSDPLVLDILNYWRGKRGDRPMPTPEDVNPAEIARYLPNILMIQVDHDPFELTYRLMGEEIVRSHGGNFRGRTVRSLDRERENFGSMLFAFYKFIAESGRPYGAGGNLVFMGRGHMCFESVYLPLSSDGVRTTRIMGASSYRKVSEAARLRVDPKPDLP